MHKKYSGLSHDQARQLLREFGGNCLTDKAQASLFSKIKSEFLQVFPLILVSASFLAIFFGEYLNASLILGVVLIGAIFNVYQNWKAEDALSRLRNMTKGVSRVIRNNNEQKIASELLVPGDIVLLESGTKIPADGILIEVLHFEVNESALTGEPFSVPKVGHDEVYAGTVCVKGRAIFQIQKTGDTTKIGQIAQSLKEVKEVATPLQKKLVSLSQFFGLFGLMAALILGILSYTQGETIYQTILLSVSVLVAVVPEALPVVMTVILAVGAYKMSLRGAIVRQMVAIETLGSSTLVATDKTGTLTTGEMRVKEIYFHPNVNREQVGVEMFLNFILCSTTSIIQRNDRSGYEVLGDTTEGALLIYATEKAHNIEDVRRMLPILDEESFDSSTKKMSILTEIDSRKYWYSKGSPESILVECTSYLVDKTHSEKLTEKDRGLFLRQISQLANEGLRVLAFSRNKSEFLGLVAIYDPPRDEAKETIREARENGIETIMITGDNERTAQSVGRTLGLLRAGDLIMTGSEIESYSDRDLLERLPKARIFARTNPQDKARIVQLYQRLGFVVVVTGDGVNDAIALKQADVGVAMGKTGTDIAVESADIVLTDDNYSTLMAATFQGREIIHHIRNAAVYLFATNASEVSVLIGCVLFGLTPIFTPALLLYTNLLGDGVPALLFAFSPNSGSGHHLENTNQLLRTQDFIYMATTGLLATIITLVLLAISPTSIAQTIAFVTFFTTQLAVFFDRWHSGFSYKTLLLGLGKKSFLFGMGATLCLQYIFTSTDASRIFRLNPISPSVFLIVTCSTFIFFICTLFILRSLRLLKP